MGNSLTIIQDEGNSLVENHRWLRTTHGWTDARSITLDGAAFQAVFPEGVVPSGVVLAYNAITELHVPYDGDAVDGDAGFGLEAVGLLMTTTGILRGVQERVLAEEITAPLFWHGEVIEENLPALSGIDEAAKASLTHISFV